LALRALIELDAATAHRSERTAMQTHPEATAAERRVPRSKKVLASLAAVLAVWLGMTAPGTSPVAPVATSQQPAPPNTNDAGNPNDIGNPNDTGNPIQDPVRQVLPDSGRPGRGRR
jgi:hypothetical protein